MDDKVDAGEGWYQDPDDFDLLRWWDGTAWTDRRKDKPAKPATATAVAATPVRATESTSAPAYAKRAWPYPDRLAGLFWLGVLVQFFAGAILNSLARRDDWSLLDVLSVVYPIAGVGATLVLVAIIGWGVREGMAAHEARRIWYDNNS